jgi:hypothetical protein
MTERGKREVKGKRNTIRKANTNYNTETSRTKEREGV